MSTVTVVYVAYGIDEIDLDWIPDGVPVVIAHNDSSHVDVAAGRAGVGHVGNGTNVGFGAGVNQALADIGTSRVILCNPDTVLGPEHFEALTDAGSAELVTIPLVEDDGVPNSVVNRYWGPFSFLATARGLGRYLPRGGIARRLVSPLLGRWGRGHAESLQHSTGSWPLSERWASAAVLSIPTDCLVGVGGFDESYFLYYEDVDLQQRLARTFPELRVRLADVAPAVHLVGGSVTDSARVASYRKDAARVFASRQRGLGWRIATGLVGGRPVGVVAT